MRESEAKRQIEAAGGSWDVFLKWMRGQTVGMYENGETDWYEYDVNRFIRYNCDPKKEPLHEMD